jgi:hypothetical protein
LPHHHLGRAVGLGQVLAIGREDHDATGLHRQHPKLLGDHGAGEPASVLGNDYPNSIALDPLQHGREARTVLDRVGTRDGGIVELAHQLVAMRLGEALDRLALPVGAVAIDIGG